MPTKKRQTTATKTKAKTSKTSKAVKVTVVKKKATPPNEKDVIRDDKHLPESELELDDHADPIADDDSHDHPDDHAHPTEEHAEAKASFVSHDHFEASPDATQLYLREIGFSPLLTAAEEIHFGRLVQKGDEAARKK